MKYTLQRYSRRAVIGVLGAGVLVLGTASLWALDIFGQGKSEEPATASASQSGVLPSLAGTIKQVSPAVVNISTTQKVERRRSRTPFGPMPGPGPNPGPSPGPSPGPNPFGGEDPFEEFFRRFFGD